MKLTISFILILFFALSVQSQPTETLHLWPGKVPGETEAKHPAVETDNKARNVTRLTDVTDPILEVFEPEASQRNGAAVIICPGGGYNILAIDLEGYEVAEWLTSLGFTAFVLQYRVPKKREGALQDIQRAVRLVRSQASQWKLNPEKLGVLGFSAGGSLAARASTRFKKNAYEPIDKIDTFSPRPDFAVLIYAAYLDAGPDRSLTPELTVTQQTPPMFLFATADDKHGNSTLVMAGALRDAKVPVESHLMPTGGHGYGLRMGSAAGRAWPRLAESWLHNIIAD